MIFKKTTGRLAWLVLIYHLALLALPHSLQAEESNIKATNEPEKQVSSRAEEPKGVNAVAVYYAKRYHGRRTHSGAVFDQNKLTAAHPTLPHGTRVKVVNLANHRSVVVTITDRCRKRSFEVIDLSRAAARKLGFLGKGSAKVRIIPLQADQ